MTALAMCLASVAGRWSFAAQNILAACHRLQMRWIAAPSITTEVVKL
jgi:hypothetical protein